MMPHEPEDLAGITWALRQIIKKRQQEVTNKFENGYFHLREKCIGTILAGFKTSELVVPDSVRLTLSTTHKRFLKQLIGSSFEF